MAKNGISEMETSEQMNAREWNARVFLHFFSAPNKLRFFFNFHYTRALFTIVGHPNVIIMKPNGKKKRYPYKNV